MTSTWAKFSTGAAGGNRYSIFDDRRSLLYTVKERRAPSCRSCYSPRDVKFQVGKIQVNMPFISVACAVAKKRTGRINEQYNVHLVIHEHGKWEQTNSSLDKAFLSVLDIVSKQNLRQA